MSTWSKHVYSSNVSEVGYDDESHDLIVIFNNGTRYAYEGVPEELAHQLSLAPSVGSMLNTEIKGYYKFRKL